MDKVEEVINVLKIVIDLTDLKQDLESINCGMPNEFGYRDNVVHKAKCNKKLSGIILELAVWSNWIFERYKKEVEMDEQDRLMETRNKILINMTDATEADELKHLECLLDMINNSLHKLQKRKLAEGYEEHMRKGKN